MPETNTIVAALKFKGGALIAADSQVSDRIVGVRWPIEKLEPISHHPLVIAFSGSHGRGSEARDALNGAGFRPTTFDKRDRVKKLIDAQLLPVYAAIQTNSKPPTEGVREIALTALAVFWAEGKAHILEREFNGDTDFHDSFHAIGSGSNTAYAVYNTLGGSHLTTLEERKAIMALLRIVKTAIKVELAYVSEPISLYSVAGGKVGHFVDDEVNIHLQAVTEWERKARDDFFNEEI